MSNLEKNKEDDDNSKTKIILLIVFLILWIIAVLYDLWVEGYDGELWVLILSKAVISALVIALGFGVFISSKYLDEQKQKRWEERKKPFYIDDE